jgi:hypothetical protein
MDKVLVILLWCDFIFFLEVVAEFLLYCNQHRIFGSLSLSDAKRRLPDSIKKRTKRDLQYCLIIAVILGILLII